MAINVNDSTATIITIGYEGENEVASVSFDYTEWAAAYGAGDITLLHQRQTDPGPYPVTLNVENNIATWVFTSVDTEIEGWGLAQLVYIVDEKIKKSMVYRTFNSSSLGETQDPPEPWETWVDEVLQAAAEAKDAAGDAAASATLAESWAIGGTGSRAGEDEDNAKYYAEQAYGSAQQAIADSMASDADVQDIIDNY